MAGKPFQVGRFAHTLRVRLMREHVGVDVDTIDEAGLMEKEPVVQENEFKSWDPDAEQQLGREDVVEAKNFHQTRPRSMMQTGAEGLKDCMSSALSYTGIA